MGTQQKTLQCTKHGEAFETFVCEHLAWQPDQAWFSAEATEDNRWPDAWCGTCETEFQKYGEWNEKNSDFLKIKILCHNCYEWARSQGWNGYHET